MKVGILGSGDVGRALGTGFAVKGHSVKIGSRTPDSDKLKAWLKETGSTASSGSFAEAAGFGDIVVIATLGSGTAEAIGMAGHGRFAGKVVIDCTNPLDFSRDGPSLTVGLTDSLCEMIQRKLPAAKVVKCFNTVPKSQMFRPKFRDVEMLICGNDADAKREVEKIVKEFGWAGVIDLGGMENARWLEALVPLWARVGMTLNTWDHVFKVLR